MMTVLGLYFKTPRIQTAAALYFLCAGILTQIPLFNYLGFEFSAVMTIPTSMIAGLLTIRFAKEYLKKPLTRKTWLAVIGDQLMLHFLLLLIPLVVISLNAFTVKNCAWSTGLLYYLLLPVITMIFSVSTALVISVLFKHAQLFYTIVVGMILFHIFAVTYYLPQLFAYNLIVGYFPGITYDETIGNMMTLMIFREVTLLVSVLLFTIFLLIVTRWKPTDSFGKNVQRLRERTRTDVVLSTCAAVCFIVIALCWLYRAPLHFQYTSGDIQQALGRRTESDHFIIYYSGNDYSISEIVVLRAIAEFDYDRVSDRLLISQKKGPKIEIYIYPSSEEKEKYIGTSNTNITKPWSLQIHLTEESFSSTFRHELVHAIAGEFGFPVVHASLRMAMNEGLAVAVDWPEGLFSPHQYASALNRDHRLQDVSTLFSYSGFAMQSSTFAYLVSGSFCKYLIDRYGIERFKYAFDNGNFLFAFGESIDHLINEWKTFLQTVDTSQLPDETVRSLFSQQSIFYKTCAREVAKKNKAANDAFTVRNYPLAEHEYAAAYEDAPSLYALRGLLISLIAQKKYDNALSLYSDLPRQSLWRIHPAVMMAIADASCLKGDARRSYEIYNKIIAMNYSESYSESSLLREQMINDDVSPDLFYSLLYSGMPDSLKVESILVSRKTQGARASLTYLNAVMEARLSRDSISMSLFREVNTDDLDQRLNYYLKKRMAAHYFRFHQYEMSKREWWEAMNDAPTENALANLREKIDLCESVEMQLH